MTDKPKSGWPFWLFAILLILIDQASKYYVKTHFYLGEELIIIPNWFRFSFTENPGVAFGLEMGGELGKYFLSIFRIVFSLVIAIFLYYRIRAAEHKGILIAIAMILAGAIGNVIDGIFYGSIFSGSLFHSPVVAKLVPFGQGYSSLLQGKVVDFLYFPLIDTVWPEWAPFGLAGHPLRFFNAIFNVADSCITLGLAVCLSLISKSKMN